MRIEVLHHGRMGRVPHRITVGQRTVASRIPLSHRVATATVPHGFPGVAARIGRGVHSPIRVVAGLRGGGHRGARRFGRCYHLVATVIGGSALGLLIGRVGRIEVTRRADFQRVARHIVGPFRDRFERRALRCPLPDLLTA